MTDPKPVSRVASDLLAEFLRIQQIEDREERIRAYRAVFGRRLAGREPVRDWQKAAARDEDR